MNDETPISITLDSRKVYIGYVSEIPATPNDGFVVLVPLLSGYRDEKTLEFRETENYAEKTFVHVEGEDPKEIEFFNTISIKGIVSACVFDMDAYYQYFASKAQPPKMVTDVSGFPVFSSTSEFSHELSQQRINP